MYAQVGSNGSRAASAVDDEAVAAAAAAAVAAAAAAAAAAAEAVGSVGQPMENGTPQLERQRAAEAAAAAAGQQVGFMGQGQTCLCYSIGGSSCKSARRGRHHPRLP